ncbi:DUF1501 domain-containing protein [Longispora sp. K20-0274]|uniref:DUF1501 domain-containing protein n=1 Tax=Longispora sp. K20-0274 TaxID=3088255 RepID=UPI00399ACEB3
MDTVTRRRFLIGSGVVAAGAIAAGGAALTLPELLSTASPTWRGGRTLVVITLYGGNDGLNTLVPYADDAYHAARPDLAYKPDQVLALDKDLGLNPALKGFKKLWDAKKLAIVRGVGYPRPNRSHFSSMDIWQTGSPETPVRTGWLGRWLDVTKRAPVDAISLDPVLPPMLAGARVAGGSVPLKGLKLPKDLPVAALAKVEPGESALRTRAAASYADLLSVNALVSKVQGTEPEDPDAIGAQLDLVARCVEANIPTKVYSVSHDGFDTHAVEHNVSERLLGELDTAVTAFLDRMSRTPAGEGVVVLVYSEFGRRVKGNASEGTDHGTAGVAFVAGAQVLGGYYGRQPSLTELDNGDLRVSTDFRDVYATLLERVLDTDPGKVLSGWSGRVPLL